MLNRFVSYEVVWSMEFQTVTAETRKARELKECFVPGTMKKSSLEWRGLNGAFRETIASVMLISPPGFSRRGLM